jgi:tetratricopeptide (TPR) repeat protein
VQASPGSPSVSNASLARRNLDRAETLAQALPAQDAPEERALILARLALARAQLAAAFESDFDAAHRSLDRATALLEDSQRSAPENSEAANLRSDIAWERANILQWQGRYAESIDTARGGLSKLATLVTSTPQERSAALLRRTRLLDIYAESLYYTDDMQRSEQAYREAMELLKGAYVAEPDNPAAARRFMRSEWALGETLLELKRADEAEPLFADATTLFGKLQLLEPRDRDLARTGIVISTAHARALAALGRHSEALPLLERSVADRRRLWDEAPKDWSAARDYAIGLASLAEGRAAARQYPAACAAWDETLATFERIRAAGKSAQLDEDHTVRITREEQARYCR